MPPPRREPDAVENGAAPGCNDDADSDDGDDEVDVLVVVVVGVFVTNTGASRYLSVFLPMSAGASGDNEDSGGVVAVATRCNERRSIVNTVVCSGSGVIRRECVCVQVVCECVMCGSAVAVATRCTAVTDAELLCNVSNSGEA
jgi:hypothetical protein